MKKNNIIQKNTKKFRRVNEQGFTLIELMVSLSLFIIVVLAAISSLYSVNNASRKIESMRNVLDNLNFAMESMSRTIRTGNNIDCLSSVGFDCPLGTIGTSAISLTTTFGASPHNVQYSFDQANGRINKTVGGSTIAITSPEINIQKLTFYVEGADPNDDKQPSVMIFVEGIAKAGADNITPFALQTYISQRAIE